MAHYCRREKIEAERRVVQKQVGATEV